MKNVLGLPAHPPRGAMYTRRLAAALAAALAAIAAGCGSGGSTASSSPPTTTSQGSTTMSAAGRAQYPVAITDCGGRKTTYAKAPARVVTIDPNITEMLLLLGLKDRIAGYTEWYSPNQQWPSTKAAMKTLHQINVGQNYPTKEAVVARSPDLVASVYTYSFMTPLPTRASWARLGVDSYEALGECSSTAPADFSLLYDDMRNLGAMFGVQSRTEARIAALKSRVARLQRRVRAAHLPKRTIAIYDGTPDHPTTYGGTANAVISLAGAKYLWAGFNPNKLPSWEQFVKGNPDVIWIVPDAGHSVSDLERKLESDPRLKNVTAVKKKAYVVVPQADATVESPRNVDGLAKLVDGLIAVEQGR
jgi:iron complex transport system substrate-binding protein